MSKELSKVLGILENHLDSLEDDLQFSSERTINCDDDDVDYWERRCDQDSSRIRFLEGLIDEIKQEVLQ